MLNETLKNNAPENAASGNSAANAWQNMAAAVQETTKNMNKYELGKRALRAAIVGLTALALAGPSFSKNSNKAPKEAPVSVEWAEPAATTPAETGISPEDQSPTSAEEAAAMFAEARGKNRESATANLWENSGAQPMDLTPVLPSNATQK